MTAKKDLKRLVRARANKTGESYAAALRHFRKEAVEAQRMAQSDPTPAVRTPAVRRIDKPEHGFAVHVPEDWGEEPPDPFSSEREVARFHRSGVEGVCLVFRSRGAPGYDSTGAATAAEAHLVGRGFGNFRHLPTRVAGLPAARLDFDRPAPDGGVWSCRQYFVTAAGHLFTLGFGTAAIAVDAQLLDELASRFELIGTPPGSPSATAGAAGGVSPPAGPVIRFDAALRNRVGPYSARARRVLVVAHEEAIRRQAPSVEQEHILAGIASVAESAGLAILAELGVSRERLERELELILPPPPAAANQADAGAASAGRAVVSLPLAERAEHTLASAEDEARTLGHAYVGVEHFLLGLLRQESGPAAGLLARLGLTPDAARVALREVQRARPGTPP